jgi:hypothetical protein
VTQVGLARQEQRDGPEHPHDREPGEGAEHEAAGGVERPEARLADARPHRRSGERPERLEQDRADCGAGQRGERRIRRARPALQQRGRQPRPEPRPEHDARD